MRVHIFLAVIAFATTANAEPALIQGQALAEGIDAFPRLSATTPQAAAINAKLAAMEMGPLQSLKDCDGNRSVTTAYIGAEFLSLVETADGMCAGAAHPFYFQAPISFDLTTGAQLDWAALLPKTLLDPESADFDPMYPLRSEALERAYLKALAAQAPPDPDCIEAYGHSSPLDFDFWLDRAHRSLALAPNNLPYAATACVDTVYLSWEKLTELDAPARLIAALRDVR